MLPRRTVDPRVVQSFDILGIHELIPPIDVDSPAKGNEP